MTTPSFKRIFQSRYIIYLSFSFCSFFILLFLVPFNWGIFIELTAIFFYSIGVITLLSFSSILFITTKIDLFGSFYKMQANPPSLQSFIIFLIYALSIGFVILIHWLFSVWVAIGFMFISGGISIILSNFWFNYLYRCFYPNKYEKMEIFRMQ
jgi:hypothetical protein